MFFTFRAWVQPLASALLFLVRRIKQKFNFCFFVKTESNTCNSVGSVRGATFFDKTKNVLVCPLFWNLGLSRFHLLLPADRHPANLPQGSLIIFFQRQLPSQPSDISTMSTGDYKGMFQYTSIFYLTHRIARRLGREVPVRRSTSCDGTRHWHCSIAMGQLAFVFHRQMVYTA